MNDSSTRNRIVSLADLVAQAPSVYQVLNRVARQLRRRRAARVAQSAGWFGAGIAVGTGLVALLTPNGVREARHRLSSRARRVREYLAPQESGAARTEASRSARETA
jgi:hypothetical protein